jgi:hypothetical protein
MDRSLIMHSPRPTLRLSTVKTQAEWLAAPLGPAGGLQFAAATFL